MAADEYEVGPHSHKVGDEGQGSDHSGQLARRTPSGGFRRLTTFASEIWPAAATIVRLPPVASPERAILADHPV